MKKKEELPADIDLDMPPEPPKMGMEEEVSTKEPIDEELMPRKKTKKGKQKIKLSKEKEKPGVFQKDFPTLPPKEAEELLDIPPLPKVEEELPPLPGETTKEFGEEGLDLPPPPVFGKKEKRAFFSFLKPKKAAGKLSLPKIEEEIPEIPSLPEVEEKFPEIPPIPEREEVPPMPILEKEAPIAQPPKAPSLLPEMPAPEPSKPKEEPLPKKEEIKKRKFITIDDFRQIQGDISGMKGVLRGIDDIFAKLEEVKGIGDKEYGGLYNSLKDIQRKIMFVDKTLFEEEA